LQGGVPPLGGGKTKEGTWSIPEIVTLSARNDGGFLDFCDDEEKSIADMNK